MSPQYFKTHLQSQNINFRNNQIPILHQNEPYIYLGIQLVPSLKWKLQIHATTTKLTQQCKQLLHCPVTMKQKINMLNTIIRVGVTYSFYVVPYSMLSIKNWTKSSLHYKRKSVVSPIVRLTLLLNSHTNFLAWKPSP
jgi:hypothetical protein